VWNGEEADKTQGQKVEFRTRVNRDDSGYLGYGYDVIESRYFNPSDIEFFPVIDVYKFLNEGKKIEKIDSNKKTWVRRAGGDVLEYTEEVSKEMGISTDKGIFKQDLKSLFDINYKTLDTTAYGSTYFNIESAKERFENTSVEELKKYLTNDFIDAINDDSFTAADIIDLYGTHVLIDISLGTRAQVSWEAPAQNIDTLLDYTTDYVLSNRREHTSIATNSSKIKFSFLKDDKEREIYYQQSLPYASLVYDSLQKGSPSGETFIDSRDLLREENTKTGIWLFVENKERQAAIEAEYKKRLKEARLYYESLVLRTYVKNIGMYYSKNKLKTLEEVRRLIGEKLKHSNFVVIGEKSENADYLSFRGGIEEDNILSKDIPPRVYLYYETTTSYEESIKGIIVNKVPELKRPFKNGSKEELNYQHNLFKERYPTLDINLWTPAGYLTDNDCKNVLVTKGLTGTVTTRSVWIWQSKIEVENGLVVDFNDQNKVHPVREVGILNGYKKHSSIVEIPHTIRIMPTNPNDNFVGIVIKEKFHGFFDEKPSNLTWRRKPYNGEK
ncbi:MAG: hypothetical protein ACRC5H_02095, partial [Treponemataceae bacterium]